jgi:hypothetical protein
MEVLDLECVENGRKVLGVELNVNDGTNDGFDLASDLLRFCSVRTSSYGRSAKRARRGLA